jgi:hypothetical protein
MAMVTALIKVGVKEEHLVVVSACSLSEGVKVSVDGDEVLDTTAPRPPGIAQVEIGREEKHLVKIVLGEGIVCRIDVYVDGKLYGSY